MAFSVAVGVQGNNNFNNQASFVTASWTPTANRLLIASFNTTRTNVTPTPTISGNGLTWSLLTNQEFDTGPGVGDKRYRLTTWVALTGASPSTGAITISVSSNCNGYNFVCDEVNGADISGTALAAIIQTKLGPVDAAAGDLTITLDNAITGTNASYGAMCHEISGGTATAGSGYTKSGEQASSTPGRLHTQYRRPGSTTVDCTWSGSGQFGGVGLEISLTDVTVTPATATLTITRFAPAVSTPRLVTPSTATLIITTFAPVITATTSAENEVWVETWPNEVWVETWED